MRHDLSRRTYFAGLPGFLFAQSPQSFPIRRDYLREAENIPAFWKSSVADVSSFLERNVIKGRVEAIGTTAGGRTVRAVFYGTPRQKKGSTTFSGSLGYGDIRAWLGPDFDRKVYFAMAGVHGGEFEGIVGAVNLLSVFESGNDLRGRAWPDITATAQRLDRIIVLPIANVDGRSRVPVRMLPWQGTDPSVSEYFNTGGKLDGSIIGWPQCKRDIPLDFSKVQFPGGYPNDAGVNFQHDDFFGHRQPETAALLDLVARERPDLALNMHTGSDFLEPLRPFNEPVLMPVFDELYRRVITHLARQGLQRSDDVKTIADPSRQRLSVFNLDSALNMHCGALSVLVESPSHAFTTAERNGRQFVHTPEQLLDAQLICHLEAMKLLADTGGRARWSGANVRR
jgi:hypothetical protein